MPGSAPTPYVFISYAHIDSNVVLPIISAMKNNNISLWYDEGIEAGSEWPEYIAEKVMNCSKFVLFISRAYLNSQNCKRELNFAISRKKDILSIYLEDVELSPGMELQLGTYQAIFKKRFDTTEIFHQSICREHFFEACRTKTDDEPRNTNSSSASQSHTQNNTGSFQQPTDVCGQMFGNSDAAQQKTEADPATSPEYDKNDSALPVKKKVLAGILAILLGGFGVHSFYLGQIVKGILYLIFFWTYIPSLIGIIEGIMILCSSDEKFQKKYNCRIK